MTKQKIGFAIEPEIVEEEKYTPPTQQELLDNLINMMYNVIRQDKEIKSLSVKVDFTGKKKVTMDRF